MKNFLSEFKRFALRGNVMDLAVGVIVGAAFQNIVTSLTRDILSPVIGLFTGQNFDTLSIDVLGASIAYGAFFTAVINFVITAFVVFLLVKGMNKLASLGDKKKADPGPAAPTQKQCPHCMSTIDARATRCPHCIAQL